MRKKKEKKVKVGDRKALFVDYRYFNRDMQRDGQGRPEWIGGSVHTLSPDGRESIEIVYLSCLCTPALFYRYVKLNTIVLFECVCAGLHPEAQPTWVPVGSKKTKK